MVPGKYDITVYRGGTFDVKLSAKDSNGDINFSSVYNSAVLRIYRAWITDLDDNPNNYLYELSTGNGMIELNGTAIHLHIPATVTQTFDFESGVYLLKLIVTGIDPIVDPFLEGRVKIKIGA